MGQFVIACYKPHPGKESELLALVLEHVPILRDRGLATGRVPYIMRAADGTLLEVFEWISPEAIDRAHSDEVVAALWQKFATLCSYQTLASLPEAHRAFAPFQAIDH